MYAFLLEYIPIKAFFQLDQGRHQAASFAETSHDQQLRQMQDLQAHRVRSLLGPSLSRSALNNAITAAT